MNQTVRFLLGLSALCTLLTSAQAVARAEALSFKIEVKAGKHDRVQTPVKLVFGLPKAAAEETHAQLAGAEGGPAITGQLTAPSLLADTDAAGDAEWVARELHFILPALKAGQSAIYTVKVGGKFEGPSFAWQDTAGQYNELQYGGKPVLRYMYRAFDDSTPENRFLTYKVFHHLFNQAGDRIVTNGPDGHSPYEFKSIKFPHHRGIFYGFNKISYGQGQKADLWHCQGDNYQGHKAFLASDTGPVLGRHSIAIAWNGKGKQPILNEQREITVYQLPGGRLIEFASLLKSEEGKLTVDGDPQHAGFQFRAHNDVAAKTAKQTYYLRVDGNGKPGATKNWPGDKDQVNFPWKGMSFVLDGQRYTVAYIDKPTNPKEARFSERDYGRFGSYFTTQIEPEAPLAINYRLWFQDGEMTGKQIEAISTDFVEPPEVATIE
jgi:hypothetical protein